METKLISPRRMVTRDRRIFSRQILEIYFRIFNAGQGRIVPPCQVVHRDTVLRVISEMKKNAKAVEMLRRYLDRNPEVEYILVDGNHKAAAAALACSQIPAVVIKSASDLRSGKKLVESGEMLGWYKPSDTIEEMVEELVRTYRTFPRTKAFISIEDKVERMVRSGQVPKYMIDIYKREKHGRHD